MPAVDMLGLNDAVVARQAPDPRRPVGHRRVASADYLRERQVTFVLGHPAIADDPLRLSPRGDQLVVRVDHGLDWVNDGRPFYLQLSTAGDRDALVASLRARGVSVLD